VAVGFAEGEYSLEGYQAYDVYYEKIGKVDDLFVDEEDQPKYVGVKPGFLDTRVSLIPIELVRVNDKRKLVEVEVDKTTIKEGPSFIDDREITLDFERRVLDYYRVETRQTSAKSEASGMYYPGVAYNVQVDLRPGEHTAGTRVHLEEAHFSAERASADRGHGDELGNENGLRIQRSEEDLRIGTHGREAGGMQVRKRVRTDRERFLVPEQHQEVRVERAPVEEGVALSTPEIGDDEIRIPVIEEEIVVERRPVVKEEIRLRKEVVEEEEIIEEEVRKEELDIDEQTRHRKAFEGSMGIDDHAVRFIPKESSDKRCYKSRKTERKRREASKKGQQRATNTKVTKGACEGAKKRLPIEGYDGLTVEKAKKKLGGLSKGELKKIWSYEKRHKNRKTLVEHLDRKIKGAS